MKLYDFKRVTLFEILGVFDIQMIRIGTIWAEGFLTDEMASKILAKFPGSIEIMTQ